LMIREAYQMSSAAADAGQPAEEAVH
jgi:hypothetical protein